MPMEAGAQNGLKNEEKKGGKEGRVIYRNVGENEGGKEGLKTAEMSESCQSRNDRMRAKEGLINLFKSVAELKF